MKILAIGDACGSLGCEAVRKWLPALKKEKKIDTYEQRNLFEAN